MELTDIELMLQAQQGDIGAFHQLTLRYRAPLRRFLAALLPDKSQADDAAQETFLRLWASRERYEPTGKFSTYLFQIARHYALNQRQRYRHLPAQAVTTEADLEIVGPESEEPEAQILRRDQQARIRQAVADLPEHYRAVFERSVFENRKYAEIACELGIPVGTVKSRMAEAARRLRLALEAG